MSNTRDTTSVGLTQEQIEQAKELFGMFDQNGDGKIQASEIETILQQLGQNPTQQQVDEMLNESDLDRDGTISFEEFLKVTAHKFISVAENPEEANKKAFEQFDQDRDGFITRDELVKALKVIDPSHTDQEIEKMLASSDVNLDGKISYEEFCSFEQ